MSNRDPLTKDLDAIRKRVEAGCGPWDEYGNHWPNHLQQVILDRKSLLSAFDNLVRQRPVFDDLQRGASLSVDRIAELGEANSRLHLELADERARIAELERESADNFKAFSKLANSLGNPALEGKDSLQELLVEFTIRRLQQSHEPNKERTVQMTENNLTAEQIAAFIDDFLLDTRQRDEDAESLDEAAKLLRSQTDRIAELERENAELSAKYEKANRDLAEIIIGLPRESDEPRDYGLTPTLAAIRMALNTFADDSDEARVLEEINETVRHAMSKSLETESQECARDYCDECGSVMEHKPNCRESVSRRQLETTADQPYNNECLAQPPDDVPLVSGLWSSELHEVIKHHELAAEGAEMQDDFNGAAQHRERLKLLRPLLNTEGKDHAGTLAVERRLDVGAARQERVGATSISAPSTPPSVTRCIHGNPVNECSIDVLPCEPKRDEFMTCGTCNARVKVLSATDDGTITFEEHNCLKSESTKVISNVLCPHGMPLAEHICGPCSEGKLNRPASNTGESRE